MAPHDPSSQTGVAGGVLGRRSKWGRTRSFPRHSKTTLFFINLRRKHWVLIVFGSLARQRRDGMVVVMIKYKFMIQELLIRSLSIRRHACHHLFLFSKRVWVACVDAVR